MTGPQIDKVLVLSTAHVSKETATWLDVAAATEMHSVTRRAGGYGWFLSVHANRWHKLDLVAVRRLAVSHGCEWILFDRDAPAIVDLPTWSW